MSDLQCPARLFLLRGDRAPAPTTVAALRGERVVAVYGAGDEAGSAVALRLAHELGTTLQPAAGLEELADRHAARRQWSWATKPSTPPRSWSRSTRTVDGWSPGRDAGVGAT